MFERFTDRARRAMTFANLEAQRLGHDHVGTEHLLLGLVKEGTGVAAVLLQEFKIDLGAVRQTVERLGHGPNKSAQQPRLNPTDRYRRVISNAIEESATLSSNYVGTEHLLLGLLREPEGTAARVLATLNLKLEDVRAAVLNLLGDAPLAKPTLLAQAMKNLALQLADEKFDPSVVRTVAEALINAGWRPQQ